MPSIEIRCTSIHTAHAGIAAQMQMSQIGHGSVAPHCGHGTLVVVAESPAAATVVEIGSQSARLLYGHLRQLGMTVGIVGIGCHDGDVAYGKHVVNPLHPLKASTMMRLPLPRFTSPPAMSTGVPVTPAVHITIPALIADPSDRVTVSLS